MERFLKKTQARVGDPARPSGAQSIADERLSLERLSDFCEHSGDLPSLLAQDIERLNRLRRDDSSLNQSLLL